MPAPATVVPSTSSTHRLAGTIVAHDQSQGLEERYLLLAIRGEGSDALNAHLRFKHTTHQAFAKNDSPRRKSLNTAGRNA